MFTKHHAAILVDTHEQDREGFPGSWASCRVSKESGDDRDYKDPTQESDHLNNKSDDADGCCRFKKKGVLFFEDALEHDGAKEHWQANPGEGEPGVNECAAASLELGEDLIDGCA